MDTHDWRAELLELRKRAKRRVASGYCPVRPTCAARGLSLSELRRALYNLKPENDRQGQADVLRRFLGEGDRAK